MGEPLRQRAPTIPAHTRDAEASSSPLSLLLQEQRQRWHAGDRVSLETYLQEHPSLRRQTGDLLELLYHEVVLREESGETPSVEEYQRRFPEYAGEIRLHMDVHAALRSSSGSQPEVASVARGLPAVRGYEILGVLGRGGMGVVYQARQTTLNRLVALKMLATEAEAGDEELSRFRREARAIARLQHPNIVQIYEVGDSDGSLFISLEYVEGGALAQHLDGAPWPALPAAQLVATLARAMHYAHQQGVVHRDLKPANILLQRNEGRGTRDEDQDRPALAPRPSPLAPVPKITDFGLAKLLREGSAGCTRTGEVLGTPCYMAPEQVEGSAAHIGPVTDVYGLGAILYELLTGRPPFRGETPLVTCRQILAADPVAPSRLQPACPRDVETICLKCLQKEPHKRYPSAEALAEDLRRFAEGHPITARPVSLWGRVVKWSRRRPAVAALLAGIVAVTLLGLAVSTWQVQVASRALRDAKIRSYHDRIARAYQEWAAHNVRRADELLQQCEADLGTYEGEGQVRELWEWRLLKRLCNEHLLEFKAHHQQDIQCVTYSPDGKLLASCSGDLRGNRPGEVYVWDAITGARLHSFPENSQMVHRVAFDGDSRYLASAGWDGFVRLWDLKKPGAKPREWHQGHGVHCVVFHPSGNRLAACCTDGKVRVSDLTGRRLHEWQLNRGTGYRNIFSVAYSADGRWLASAGRDGRVCLIDADNGLLWREFPHDGDARRVAFSPDGRWLASGSWKGTVKLLDLTRKDAEPLQYDLNGGDVLNLAFSPDGRQLACCTRRRGVVVLTAESSHEQFVVHEDPVVLTMAFHPNGRYLATAGDTLRIKVWDLTGPAVPRRFPGHHGHVYSLAINPDPRPDHQLVALAGAYNSGHNHPATTLELWDLSTETRVRSLAGHKDSLTSVAFHPNARQVATGSADGTARLWNLATGKEERVWEHGGAVTGVAYSPDGESLATSCLDGKLHLWKVVDGTPRHTLAGPAGGCISVAFAARGRYVIAGGMDNTIRVWEVATGRALGEYHQHRRAVSTVVVNREGTRLASADLDQVLWLWDISNAGVLTPTHGPMALGIAGFRPPGGEEKLAVLRGSRRAYTSLAFSPDGRRLASVTPDRPVQLWDAQTGYEVLTLTNTPDEPRCVVFSPDGQRLVLSDDDGCVTVWDTEFLDAEARVRAAAGRALSWHWDQAESADQVKAHFAVIFHTSQGIATLPPAPPDGVPQPRINAPAEGRRAQPPEFQWYNYRGWAHAELGHWRNAQADYTQARRRNPDDSRLWYREAVAYLGAGDRAGYHNTCAQMLRQFAGNPHAAMDCLYACAPDPKAGGAAAQLVALGLALVKAQPQARGRAYGTALRAHAAALYRAGRYPDAIQAFEEAGKHFAPRAWDRFFRAMARKKLGDTARAQEEYNEAVKAMAQSSQSGKPASPWFHWLEAVKAMAQSSQSDQPSQRWFHWLERVEVESLRREAETELRAKP